MDVLSTGSIASFFPVKFFVFISYLWVVCVNARMGYMMTTALVHVFQMQLNDRDYVRVNVKEQTLISLCILCLTLTITPDKV